uniref:Uncharacterized protein n=1 Tax=Timema monikensis TaxID=170555 RepID=A0A7R9HUL3_9NEOP|nr:unnamed protein product [Timema monikensis]
MSNHQDGPTHVESWLGEVDRASYDVPTADFHTNLINDTLMWVGQELP